MGLFNKFYYYLTVYFIDDKNQKKYYYLSNDQNIQVNDFVVVNVDGEMKVCKVVDSCIYSEKQVPYPIENTKTIVSKFDKQSLNDFLDDNQIDERAVEEKDCGYYRSKTFFANGFTNEYTKLLVIENNKIIKLSGDFRSTFSGDYSLTLPDNLEYADLKTVSEWEDDEGGGTYTAQEDRSFRLKKLTIPYGYKEVDLSYVDGLCELYISNGVRKITIPSNLFGTMKALYIPKDLEEIKISCEERFSAIRHIRNVSDVINCLNFDTVFVDKMNQKFKLENGVLYYIENDRKTIIWVSKNIKKLDLDDSTVYISVCRSDLTLNIRNSAVFDNIQARFTKKGNKYYPDEFDEKRYKIFLLAFNKIILCPNCHIPVKDKLDNVVIDGSTEIIHGINASNEFFRNNKWIVNGCKTNDELHTLLSNNEWVCEKDWFGNWVTTLKDEIGQKDGFICYNKKKDGYIINSLVDLLGEDYNEGGGTLTYLIENFVEVDRKLIDVNLYDEEYFKEYCKGLTYEDAKQLCGKMNDIRKALTNILGFRQFNLEFKYRKDKVLLINMFSSEFLICKWVRDGKEVDEIHVRKTIFHNENDAEGTLRVSNRLPDNYDSYGRHLRYAVIRYKEDSNLVEILNESVKHVDKLDLYYSLNGDF